MFDLNYVLAPQPVQVRFDVSPAFNCLESIRELNEVERLSGFSEWVVETVKRLPAERLALNRLVFHGFDSIFFDVIPVMTADGDYLSYLDALANADPIMLRDQTLAALVKWFKHEDATSQTIEGELTPERLLHDEQVFVNVITRLSPEGLALDAANVTTM